MSRKQSFRPNAWGPIKHNERVSVLNEYSRRFGLPMSWGRGIGKVWPLDYLAELNRQHREWRNE
jgi:hypothetical protein